MSYQLKAAIEDASRGLPWTLTLTVQAYCNIRLICQDINAERRAIMAGRQIAEVEVNAIDPVSPFDEIYEHVGADKAFYLACAFDVANVALPGT